jgi:dipeptidyl aminopeptidase/acylaminoacyl peptidase
MIKFLFFLQSFGVFSCLTSITSNLNGKSFTPLDLVSLEKTKGYKISPCESKVVFLRSEYNAENNEKSQNLWSLSWNNDKFMKQLTNFSAGVKITEFVWIDCNTLLIFSIGSESKHQLLVEKFNVDYLNSTVLQSYLEFDISNLVYDQKNKVLLFESKVYLGMSLRETLEKDKEIISKEFSSAMIFEKLYFRYWNAYDNHKYSHIFLLPFRMEMDYLDFTAAVNLMKDSKLSCSPQPFGNKADFSINSETGKLVFSTMQDYDKTSQSYSTNTNIYLVDMFTFPGEKLCISCHNLGADSNPLFSADGNKLAYLEKQTPKYNADKSRLIVYDMKSQNSVDCTEMFDISVTDFIWMDSDTILFIAGERGRMKIFNFKISTKNITRLTSQGSISGIYRISSSEFLFSKSSLTSPTELFFYDLKTSSEFQITYIHYEHFSRISMPEVEEFEFTGVNSDKVHGWLIRPFDFELGKKYPLAFLIHGGPKSAWLDDFYARMNPLIFSGAGYVVAMINYHGSTTFGQSFIDSLTHNWGRYPFEDLMLGLDYILKTNDYIDSKRVVGLGTSFGGSMINWINGHTDRFVALVNHAGVFDTSFKYYTTDELSLQEYEFGGPPFENPSSHKEFNPSAFVDNWKTPTLVTHGGKDYRVPQDQGFATFTALQRKGLDSKLLFFPDETHWIVKEENILKWYTVILNWINKYTNKG